MGNVEEILDHMNPVRRIKIEVLDKIAAAQQVLSFFPEVRSCEAEGSTLRLSFEGGRPKLAEVVKALVHKEIPVVSVQEEKTDLEELFMKLTRGEVA